MAKPIVFFAQDLADICTIRRVQQFAEHGLAATVFGFRRHRYNLEFEVEWPHVLLGETRDGAYGQRLKALIATLPLLWRHRRTLARAEAFYARNIDLLALALLARLLFNRAVPVFYEVLDIQPALVGSGMASRLLCWAERRMLRHIRALVVSSAGFHRHYFAARQGYDGPWQLLLNRLPSEGLPPRPEPAARQEGPWVVGYHGLIRGQATFDLIDRLARRLEGRVKFVFRGVLTTVDETRFRAALAANPHLSYGGAYDNPRDLASMYGAVDLAWALDLENTDSNSRWLTPCRLFEAGYFGVPCLAVRGFEVGDLIEGKGIGWTFEGQIENALYTFFRALDAEAYQVRRERLLTLPSSEFVAGRDVAALCRLVANPEAAEPVQKPKPATFSPASPPITLRKE